MNGYMQGLNRYMNVINNGYRRYFGLKCCFLAILVLLIIAGCARVNTEDISDLQDTAVDAESDSLKVPEISRIIGGKIQTTAGRTTIYVNSEHIPADNQLAALYAERNYMPIWTADGGLLPQGEELITAIRESYREGLNPESYYSDEIHYALGKGRPNSDGAGYDAETISDLDLLLTNAYLKYAHDLYYGRVRPEQANIDLQNQERPIKIADFMIQSVNNNSVAESLNELLPKYPAYASLRNALEKYREIAAAGGWRRIPNGKLQKGSRGPGVSMLRQRLAMTGEYNGSDTGNQVFDESLEMAVKNYQDRNGLLVDGVVGNSTIESLNVSAEERVRQIELSMERLRILPHYLGDRYVLVNIANFHLYAVNNNHNALDMRIVAGKPQWNTPIFGELMTHVVINPYWNIPRSILKDEIIPRIKSDPNYLANRNIKAPGLRIAPIKEQSVENTEKADVSNETREQQAENGVGQEVAEPEPTEEELYRARYNSAVLSGKYNLRQEPGPSNPLGRIKFLFPNKYSVYLHDTPNKGFFKRAQRNFSHGCIRVENPQGLAEFVLYANPGWDAEKIRSRINSGRTQTVYLERPVPVYILYFTAWANGDGSVSFHKDIYGHDVLLQNALRNQIGSTDLAGSIQ